MEKLKYYRQEDWDMESYLDLIVESYSINEFKNDNILSIDTIFCVFKSVLEIKRIRIDDEFYKEFHENN